MKGMESASETLILQALNLYFLEGFAWRDNTIMYTFQSYTVGAAMLRQYRGKLARIAVQVLGKVGSSEVLKKGQRRGVSVENPRDLRDTGSHL